MTPEPVFRGNRRWAMGAAALATLVFVALFARAFQLQVLQGLAHRQHLLERSNGETGGVR